MLDNGEYVNNVYEYKIFEYQELTLDVNSLSGIIVLPMELSYIDSMKARMELNYYIIDHNLWRFPTIEEFNIFRQQAIHTIDYPVKLNNWYWAIKDENDGRYTVSVWLDKDSVKILGFSETLWCRALFVQNLSETKKDVLYRKVKIYSDPDDGLVVIYSAVDDSTNEEFINIKTWNISFQQTNLMKMPYVN